MGDKDAEIARLSRALFLVQDQLRCTKTEVALVTLALEQERQGYMQLAKGCSTAFEGIFAGAEGALKAAAIWKDHCDDVIGQAGGAGSSRGV